MIAAALDEDPDCLPHSEATMTDDMIPLRAVSGRVKSVGVPNALKM